MVGSDFLNMRREFFSYSEPIKFFRLESMHAQSDGKSVNRGLLVLDLGADQKERGFWLPECL